MIYSEMVNRLALSFSLLMNERRLRDYPLLTLIGMWAPVAINVLFRTGWTGALGQTIGIDFIVLYASGVLYRMDITRLYDLQHQLGIERQLIAPTSLPGSGPFSNPPFVAWAYGLLTAFPLRESFVLWSCAAVVFLAVSAWVIASHLVPPDSLAPALKTNAIFILLLSTFPFIEGLQAGQNHSLTLLLTSGACAASLRGRWGTAGLLVGLLAYKPQYVLGFTLLWIGWQRWRALLATMLVVGAWFAPVLAQHGLRPFEAFLGFSGSVLMLPWIPGWPDYLMTTPYGFFASFVPFQMQPALAVGSGFLGLASGISLIWLARSTRSSSYHVQRKVLAAAILFSIVAMPYVLLHDLLILVPVLLLLWDGRPDPGLLLVAAVAYWGSLVFSVLGAVTSIAWVALIPLVVVWWITVQAQAGKLLRGNLGGG